MKNTLDLKHMSVEEKLQVMETIWDDLCKEADSLKSPSWHEDILNEREKEIKNGDKNFMDWNKAKKHIQDQTG
jgi:hypothetical protein